MHSLAGIFALTTLMLAGLPEGNHASTLCLRDMKEWTIVVGENAIPSERYAAEEFCRLFQLATGSILKTASTPGSAGAIYLGESPAMRAHVLGFGVESLGEEGLRIRIARDVVMIAGGRPRGTLYGAYEFFERYAGVRFLTQDHTYIPENAAETEIPSGDYQYVPPFSFRWSYYLENTRYPDFATRLRVNTLNEAGEKLGGKTGQELISHSIGNYVSPAVYGKDHPEYFALVNNVRKLDSKTGSQVCSTNPDVIRIVGEGVEKALLDNPALKNISVSQMDNDEYCQCPACSALSAQEETTMAPHLALVNAVAQRIEKTHPGVRVGTLAYAYTRKPPKTMVARPNVEIMLCSIECCTLHPINDPTCLRNQAFCTELATWKAHCQNIWIWNYNTNFRGYDLPFPNFNAIAKNVQYFLDNNVRGVFMQAAGNTISTEMSDLRNYVMARCLWHPTDDAWRLVEEFCRLHYGASATPILEYERFLHQNAEVRGVHPECFPVEGEVGLDAKVARRISAYFEEALKRAPDDTTRQRVEKATIPALRACLATTPLVYDNGVYRLDTATLGKDTLERYIALCKQFNLTYIQEETPADQYFAELQKLNSGVPAALIENSVWRIIILPEQNGRIVEMTYKKTGRNLVEASTRGFNRWRSHEEWTQAGPPNAEIGRFTWEKKDRTVRMTKTLPDGGVWQRTVELPSESAESIAFQSEYTAGTPQVGLELTVHPEYNTVSGSLDPNEIAIYVKDTKWIHANRDWQWTEKMKPDQTCPRSPEGVYAYFNHAEHFGVQQTYDPNVFARLVTFWSPGRKQIGLNLWTPVTAMEKGQKIAYGYKITYLENPPKIEK